MKIRLLQEFMNRLVIFILVLSTTASFGQNSDEFTKAKEHYKEGTYELAYNYIQIVKLTKEVPQEICSVLEIKTLQKLKRYSECLKSIDHGMDNMNYSLSDLSIISEIKIKIQNDKAFQKRVAVEKLKLKDKIKNESSSWDLMDKAKNSLKSIIGN